MPATPDVSSARPLPHRETITHTVAASALSHWNPVICVYLKACMRHYYVARQRSHALAAVIMYKGCSREVKTIVCLGMGWDQGWVMAHRYTLSMLGQIDCNLSQRTVFKVLQSQSLSLP